MSASLENVRTLSELRDWLKLRHRWYLDWQMAVYPKPIPSTFHDAILAVCPPPQTNLIDPAKVKTWAGEHMLMYHERIIHQVHDWLLAHDIFGAPDCPPLDPDKDDRIFVTQLTHIAALLNFAGVRAAERSAPTGQGEGEQAEETGADCYPAEGEQGEGIDKQTRQQAIVKLKSAARRAYLAYHAACLRAEKKPDDLQDWEVYKLVKEEGIPEDSQGELTDYQLPAEATWTRYLRQARQVLGEQKNHPRLGRPHGKSIVRQDQLDQPETDDR